MYEKFRSLPKADTHSHAVYGCHLESLSRHIGKELEKPPQFFGSFENMIAFAQRCINPHTKHKNIHEYCIAAAVEDACYDNVKLLEASVDCRTSEFYDDKHLGLARYLQKLKDRWKPTLQFLPEIGIPRHIPFRQIEKSVYECIDTGVFSGIDLYGPEQVDHNQYRQVYRYANLSGLKCKVHLGEFSSSNHLLENFEILNPHEIQHGISAVTDSACMKELADRNIRLNLAPSSNISLGVVPPDIAKYPIRVFFDHGVRVSLGTDDLMLFGKTLSALCFELFNANCLEFDEIANILQPKWDF